MTASPHNCRADNPELRQHSPTPWGLCHHLQSAEKDASCKCGYRGGIWDGSESVLICEMGNCDRHEGHDMVNVGDRATQLANAAMIVEAVNSHAALQARVEELTKDLDEARQLVTEANNSLYGSQGYFHSLNGGAFNKYHLAEGIENLKAIARRSVSMPLDKEGTAT